MAGLLLTAANNSTAFNNASANLTNGFGSTYTLIPTLMALIVIVVSAVFIGSSVQRIEWLHEKLKAFSRSLYYTAIGLATAIVAAVAAAPVYFIAQADGETRAMAGYVIGGLFLAYIVLTAIGRIVDRTILVNLEEYMEESHDGTRE